jgi:hypothetical protein
MTSRVGRSGGSRSYRMSLPGSTRKTGLVPFERPRRDREGGDHGARTPTGTFDLLGFMHFWGRSRTGNWMAKRKTSKSLFRRGLNALSEWCRVNRGPGDVPQLQPPGQMSPALDFRSQTRREDLTMLPSIDGAGIDGPTRDRDLSRYDPLKARSSPERGHSSAARNGDTARNGPERGHSSISTMAGQSAKRSNGLARRIGAASAAGARWLPPDPRGSARESTRADFNRHSCIASLWID